MNSVLKLKLERISSKSLLKAFIVSSFKLCVCICLPILSCSLVICFKEVGIIVRIGLWLLTEVLII